MKSNFHVWPAAALALLLCSCIAPVTIKTVLNPDDYSHLPRTGTGQVYGEVLAVTKGGDLKSAAGSFVHLDPVTPYSSDAYKALHDQGIFIVGTEAETFVFDPIMLAARRSGIVDNRNRFRISHVPAGDYFVTSYVHWLKPDGENVGVWHVRRVRVHEGQSIGVEL